MKPDPTVYLNELSRLLAAEVAPRLPTTWEQAIVTRQSLLLQAAAEEFDRAAQRRVEENADLRKLFTAALPIVTDAQLHARLKAASESVDPGLLVSQLDASNRRLRSLLVNLQAHIETLQTPLAIQFDTLIWQALSRSTVRRRLSLGRF